MAGSFDARRIRAAYDTVAAAYDTTFGDELDHLPLDAMLVDELAAAAGPGPILELGAGVGPVARRLRSTHVVACDLSAAMLARCPPPAGRVQADARWLPFQTGAFAGATARYVLQHVARAELTTVVGELRRVLRPGAVLLVAVHLGHGEVELAELLGHTFQPIGGAFHSHEEMRAVLAGCGFVVHDSHVRDPVGSEGDSRRLYVVAAAG